MGYYKFLDEDQLAEARFQASKKFHGKKDLDNIFGSDGGSGGGSMAERGEMVSKLLSEPDKDEDKGFLDSIIAPFAAAGGGVLKALRWTGDKALQGVRAVDKAIPVDVAGWQPKDDAGGIPKNFREAVSAPESLSPTGPAGVALGALDTALTAAIDPLTYVTLGAGAAAKGAATQGSKLATERTIRFAGKEVMPVPRKVDAALDSARTSIAGTKVGRTYREAFVPRAPLVDAAGGSTAATRAMADVIGGAQEGAVARQADIVAKAPFIVDDFLEQNAKQTGMSVDEMLERVGKTKEDFIDDVRSQAIGASTKVLSRDVLKAAKNAGVDTSPDATKTFIKEKLPEKGAEDWVKFGDAYVHKDIKEKVFNLARPEATDELVKGSRALMSDLRSATLLGSPAVIPYTTRNIANAIEFNVMDGVFAGQKAYKEAFKMVRAVKWAGEALPPNAHPRAFARMLKEKGLTESQVDEAMALKEVGTIKTQVTEYTDIGAQGMGREGARIGNDTNKGFVERLTRPGAIANQHVEETARAVNALHKMRKQGMTPADAAFSANRAHISYSPVNFTKFERDKIKPIAFFYSFVARNPGVVARATLARPGGMANLTRAGFGFSDADTEKNTFGEPLGWYPDTPGMSALRAAESLEDPAESVNPLLAFLLDPNRGKKSAGKLVKDFLPPVGSVARWGEAISGSEERPLDRELKKLSGAKYGVDYSERDYMEKVEERRLKAMEEGKEFRPSDRDRLIVLAADKGIPSPYDKSKAQLARALKEAGVSNDYLADVLRPRK